MSLPLSTTVDDTPPIGPVADQALRRRLRELVATVLGARLPAAPYSDDDTLAELGMASMDMVTLLLGLEQAFDFDVPQEEITADVFRSIATLDAMVRRRLPGLVAT